MTSNNKIPKHIMVDDQYPRPFRIFLLSSKVILGLIRMRYFASWAAWRVQKMFCWMMKSWILLRNDDIQRGASGRPQSRTSSTFLHSSLSGLTRKYQEPWTKHDIGEIMSLSEACYPVYISQSWEDAFHGVYSVEN